MLPLPLPQGPSLISTAAELVVSHAHCQRPNTEPANLSTFLPQGSPWYPRSSPSSYPGNPQREHHRDNQTMLKHLSGKRCSRCPSFGKTTLGRCVLCSFSKGSQQNRAPVVHSENHPICWLLFLPHLILSSSFLLSGITFQTAYTVPKSLSRFCFGEETQTEMLSELYPVMSHVLISGIASNSFKDFPIAVVSVRCMGSLWGPEWWFVQLPHLSSAVSTAL